MFSRALWCSFYAFFQKKKARLLQTENITILKPWVQLSARAVHWTSTTHFLFVNDAVIKPGSFLYACYIC